MNSPESEERSQSFATSTQNTERSKKRTKGKSWTTLLIHLALMVVVTAVLIWMVLKWLDIYTRRNAVVEVPAIVGKELHEAEEILARDQLALVVSDSVYNDEAVPGSIIETVPNSGSRIKKGRKIFVTINAFSVRTRAVPNVHEISMRQALAMLRALGFDSVTVRYVGGPYNDLALYLKTSDGKVLNPGEKIPYNTPLVLEVSANDPSLMLGTDSLAVKTPEVTIDTEDQQGENENWF